MERWRSLGFRYDLLNTVLFAPAGGSRRVRAPAAELVLGDVTAEDLGPVVDHVVTSFVLHNLDSTARVGLLRRAASVLAPGGSIGVLDWARMPHTLTGALWRRCLATFEPSPNVAEMLDGRLDRDVRSAELDVTVRRRVANGRAEVLILTPRVDNSRLGCS